VNVHEEWQTPTMYQSYRLVNYGEFVMQTMLLSAGVRSLAVLRNSCNLLSSYGISQYSPIQLQVQLDK